MRKASFTAAVLFLASSAVALTGKVVDQAGAPLQGVIVQLVADGAMVVTGRDGSFTLKPNQPLDAQGVDRSKVRMRLQDGVLLFTNHGGAWSVRTLDVAGNEVAASSGNHGSEGEVQFSLFGSRIVPPGIYLVEYRNGSTMGTIRVAATKHSLAIGSPSGSKHSTLMRHAALESVDSLSFSKSGYATRRLPVTDDDQDLGTVVLDRDFGIPWTEGITYGTLTDSRDGQSYRTVVIGTQTWMAQNLNYRNTTGSVDTVGRCYNNSADSCVKYGRLYKWAEVMQRATSSALSPSGVMGLCPTGWHVPSDAEWTALNTAVGGEDSAGTELKSTSGWRPDAESSGNGTDIYGFRALPGGFVLNGSLINMGEIGYWWSATEENSTMVWYRYMFNVNSGVYRFSLLKIYGFSVRCLED